MGQSVDEDNTLLSVIFCSQVKFQTEEGVALCQSFIIFDDNIGKVVSCDVDTLACIHLQSHENLVTASGDSRVDRKRWLPFLLFAGREIVISSFFWEKFLNNLKKFLSEYLECASDPFFLNCIFVHHSHIELFTVIEDVNSIDIFFLKVGELLILD